MYVFVVVDMMEVSRCGFQSSPDRSTTSTNALWCHLSFQSDHLKTCVPKLGTGLNAKPLFIGFFAWVI